VIDHLAKGSESRAYGAGGTMAKKRAAGGVSLRVTVLEPFVPGKGGRASLAVHKDRHGGLTKHRASKDREPLAGTFRLVPNGERLTWEVDAPADGERNPNDRAPAADVAAVAQLDPTPKTGSEVAKRLVWRKDRALRTFKTWREEAR